jgi:hypothetical protein
MAPAHPQNTTARAAVAAAGPQDLKDIAKEVGAAVKASAKKDELVAALLEHQGGVDGAGELDGGDLNGGAAAGAAAGVGGGGGAAGGAGDGKHSAIVFALDSSSKVRAVVMVMPGVRVRVFRVEVEGRGSEPWSAAGQPG